MAPATVVAEFRGHVELFVTLQVLLRQLAAHVVVRHWACAKGTNTETSTETNTETANITRCNDTVLILCMCLYVCACMYVLVCMCLYVCATCGGVPDEHCVQFNATKLVAPVAVE